MDTQDITQRWQQVGLLDHFEDYDAIRPAQAAILLEQQHLFNETLNDVDSDVTSHRFLVMFRRVSVPAVIRVALQLKTPHLIKFEPITETETTATRHTMKTVLPDPQFCGFAGATMLDVVSELIATVSQQLALEIDLHVLSELRSHAGIVSYIDPTDPNTDVVDRYHQIVDEIDHTTGFTPNWVVASSEVAEYLPEVAADFVPAGDDQSATLGIRYLGDLLWQNKPKQKLFENTFAPEHELLLGCHHKDADTFVFQPKILIEPVIVKKRNRPIRKARLRSEFETRWPADGGNFYARINVKAPEIDFD